jgi:hypothetical protein
MAGWAGCLWCAVAIVVFHDPPLPEIPHAKTPYTPPMEGTQTPLTGKPVLQLL